MSAGRQSPAAGERARLFVALELPIRARETLARWGSDAVPGIRGVRLSSPEAMHATLCFLGWREVGEIEQIGRAYAAAVAAGGAGSPRLSFAGAIWLPQRRPRVLAVRLEDASGALGQLQASVSSALSTGGWYAPETRPYLGHVTVARVGRGARARGIELPAPEALAFHARSVTLYRSRLERGGARYQALRRVELRVSGHPPSGNE